MEKRDLIGYRYTGLVDKIFSLYKHNFGVYFKITAAFLVVPIFAKEIVDMRWGLPALTSGFFGSPSAQPPDPFAGDFPFNAGLFWEVIGTYCFIGVIDSLVMALYAGPVITLTSHKVLGRDIPLMEAFRIGAWKYYTLVLATIVYLLLTLAVSVGGMCGTACGASAAAIYVAVLCGLYMPAIVLEEAGWWESIRRSVALVKGMWWFVFRLLAGVTIIQGVLVFTAQMSFSALANLLVSWNSSLEIFSTVFSATGLTLVVLFARPLLFIAITLIFYEIKTKKEAFDLEMMIQNF